VTADGDDIRLDMVPVKFDIVTPGTSLITGEAGQPPKVAA
jgi:fumarate reductase flavoprotein subunit